MKLITIFAVIHTANCFSRNLQSVQSSGNISTFNHLTKPVDGNEHVDHVIPPKIRSAVAKARRVKIGILGEDDIAHEDHIIPTKKRPNISKLRREKLGLSDEFIMNDFELDNDFLKRDSTNYDVGMAIRVVKSLLAP